MNAYREPLEVPTARTLLALHHWPTPRNARARPNLKALALMDFLLRFPVALESAFKARGREMPAGARPTPSERDALENEQLALQLALWPSRHRLVAGGLLGRNLARTQPAVAGAGLALTALGARAAADLASRDEWRRIDVRASTLARSLRIGAAQLPSLTALAVAGPSSEASGGRKRQ